MKKALFTGLLSLTISTLATAGVTSGEFMEHEYCMISLPSYNHIEGVLKAKGLVPATFQFQYQKNGIGPVLTSQLTTDDSNLVSRRNSKIDGGEAELQTKLKSIRYSGVPALRLFNANGAVVPVKTLKTNTHLGAMINTEFEIKDSDSIRAELVNVFEQGKLISTNEYWYKLEYQPIHQITALKTKAFTLRSVAKSLLENDKTETNKMNAVDKIIFQIIAGYQVSNADRKSITEERLRDTRTAMIQYALAGKLTEDQYFEKITTAIPNCSVVK